MVHFNGLVDRLQSQFWLKDGLAALNNELGGDRPADQIGPDVRVELPSMGGEHFLPCQQFRALAVDDNAVEIEDQCFNHGASE